MLRIIVLVLSLNWGLYSYAQPSLSIYGGATYVWTTFTQSPDNTRSQAFSGINPMYGPTYGFKLGYQLIPSLQLELSSGYQGMGWTSNSYVQSPLHLIPVQVDVLIHAEKAPDFLKRLSFGGGVSAKGILNKRKQTVIFGYGEFREDMRGLISAQARLQYEFPGSILLGIQYDHHLSPHMRQYLFGGAVVLGRLHRALSITIGYKIR